MLIPVMPAQQNQLTKLNCAGSGCEEREGCRRYRVRIGEDWRRWTGRWGSFDVERGRYGTCEAFVRWIRTPGVSA
jgi:hypothetical protein